MSLSGPMTVHYDVFLPPMSLTPFSETHDWPSIRLQALRSSPESASQASSLRLRLPVILQERSNYEQVVASTCARKRTASDVLSEGSHDRDRPSRLKLSSRLSVDDPTAPAPTMPFGGVEISDSFISLNTTTSNPSQFPPTADDRANTSVSNLPRWHIPLSKLSTLQSLLRTRPPRRRGRPSEGLQDQLVNVLLCVTSVEAPVLRQRKEEKAAGKQGTLWIAKWSVIAQPENERDVGHSTSLGDEVACDIKLWDDCARELGEGKVRRGDVILIQGVQFKPSTAKEKAHLVLSSTRAHSPSVTVVYRTLPRYRDALGAYKAQPVRRQPAAVLTRAATMDPHDRLLRPDLRLGRSDAGIRKVAEIARWFAEWVGGDAPPG
ncbi:hypothetical protein BD324DRAFT_354081 [Kockovaella imperatae]|uniref:Uncharacterized protein n=1 Tax=Kockovaella imperatae TaxID=4999 RepID=A0A1Y1ULH6_9TREE|nr:hypothetical protein BD324DRAFT_354081 [Kockovaella imperatae]ORX38397.1 hypothetical protein BD324DRAFT_354081 [Kockovaella imperatae]